MAKYDKAFIEGQVALVFFHDKPAFFIRIENIEPDQKKGWWHVNFITLSIPISQMTWILSDDQIRGDQFTMQGNPIRLERVEAPDNRFDQAEKEPSKPAAREKRASNQANIVSLFGDEEEE
jgi:hypothetical protein